MRITILKRRIAVSNYPSVSIATSRKRPVNLTLSEGLVEQARAYSENLSATVENLLAEYVQHKPRLDLERQKSAQACAMQWNAVNASVGSFADEHSTL
jgi:post-segregation antitoxin (ccd killing protein)